MLVEIVGWDGEERQARLFDVPTATVEALQFFVASGQVAEHLADELDDLRQSYLSIADTPISGLDHYYRERLAAMYIWNELAGNEITADLSWEFSLR